MSKLDDILKGDTLGVHDKEELKQQIKDLFLELVGEDELIFTSRSNRRYTNQLRQELRNKVERL